MIAGEVKQIADRCEQIDDFVRELDSWGNAELSTSRDACGPIPKVLCAKITREIWPELRKQLVAKYDELAATINADKFFDADDYEAATEEVISDNRM